MVFETIDNLVLKFFHPLGFLQPMPLWGKERRMRKVTGLAWRWWGWWGVEKEGLWDWRDRLTCDHGQGSDAGEGRDVNVHVLQVGGKLNNGIDPLSKAADALQPVQDHPVAEDELALRRVGPGRKVTAPK